MGLAVTPSQRDLLQELCLVGDILEFVQFGTRLLTSPEEVESEVNLDAQSDSISTSLATKEVQSQAWKAIYQCRSYEDKFQREFAGPTLSTPKLHMISRECYSAVRLMRKYLARIHMRDHRPRRGWTSLKTALIKVWSKKGMNDHAQHLSCIKESIENDILNSICARVTPAALKESPEFLWLEPDHRELILALSAGLAPGFDDATSTTTTITTTQVRALCLLLSRSESALPTERRPSVQSIASNLSSTSNLSSCFSSFMNASVSPDSYDDSASTSSSFASITGDKEAWRRDKVSEQLLNDLVAVPTSRSQSGVEDATRPHREIYEEILDEPTSSFQLWLQEPNEHVYWITGPRGSGKSTLLESIQSLLMRDGSTNSEVEVGPHSIVDNTKLVVARFTSSPGGRQRSQVELYQSILYEVLRQDHRLIPLIFPREWSVAYCKSMGYACSTTAPPATTAEHKQKPNWSLDQLKVVVGWLFSQDVIPFRACLIIDGLDEYENIESDADVDETVHQIVSGGWTNAKCCISTQSSAAFSAAFEGQPSLQMAEVTYAPMHKFALELLALHDAFKGMRGHGSKVLHQCVNEVVEAANGVFLWAELAIGTVMREHAEGDGMRELRGRIRSLPRRLEGLYEYIIKGLAAKKRGVQTCRLFRLIAAVSTSQEDDWTTLSPLTLLGLSFALEHDAAMLAISAPHFTTQQIEKREDAMTSSLSELSGGLIRVQRRTTQGEGADPNADHSTVAFISDSLAAFVAKSETQEYLERKTLSTTQEPYSPSLAILGAIVLSMKTERPFPSSDRLSEHRHVVDDGILYARRAESELGFHPVLNLVTDELVEMANCFRLNTLSQSIFHPGCTKHGVAAQCGLHQYLRYLLIQDNVITPQGKQKQQQQRRPSTASTASSCSSSSSFSQNHDHESGKMRRGSLLSLTLQPPSGLERFVSPDVVRTLIAFGADPSKAATLLMAFLSNGNYHHQGMLSSSSWKTLLMQILPKQRRIYKTDEQALETVFAEQPEDWAEIRKSIYSPPGGTREARRKRGSVVQKRVLWIF